MQIDDYGQAIALTNKLEAALPFRVRPEKQMMGAVEDQRITTSTWLTVDSVFYSGDMGGITVTMLPEQGTQAFAVSLTHVVFDAEHELAAEVKAYQKQRKQRLWLADRGSVIAELSPPGSRKKKKNKKRKGFG